MQELNPNDLVIVKLTSEGLRIYKSSKNRGFYISEFKDGYVIMPLWQLMAMFGSSFECGKNTVFESGLRHCFYKSPTSNVAQENKSVKSR